MRWWNVRHPRAYAGRALAGQSPAQARELLDDAQRHDERVLLGSRLADGLPVEALGSEGRRAVAGLIADGLVQHEAALRDRRLVLSMRGRLLADAVVRRLVLGS